MAKFEKQLYNKNILHAHAHAQYMFIYIVNAKYQKASDLQVSVTTRCFCRVLIFVSS